ncbi:MAG: hypothetical protein ABI640_12645 [Gammaproteobacteria bacterium]
MARRPLTPRASVDEQLAALDALPTAAAERRELLAQSLAARNARVVAKAARLAEETLAYDLVPQLLAAWPQFVDKPTKTDPSCIAKKALARALVALDCTDAEFFMRGLKLSQPAPVWGGTVDTAVDVRCSCAMGLVASGYSRALVELTTLLNDEEAEARAGAVRAAACGNPREAELVLRMKVRSGDSVPGVLGECFTGLLAVAPEDSLALVAAHLDAADEAVREFAALALGDSRLDAALPPLKAAWQQPLQSRSVRRALLRAAVAHRSEAALAWLLSLAAESRVETALEVVEALALYKHNATLATRLDAVLVERGEPSLTACYAELWRGAKASRS